MKFGIGSTFEWNGKNWKIIGFKKDETKQSDWYHRDVPTRAEIQEVNGSTKTTIDLRFLRFTGDFI